MSTFRTLYVRGSYLHIQAKIYLYQDRLIDKPLYEWYNILSYKVQHNITDTLLYRATLTKPREIVSDFCSYAMYNHLSELVQARKTVVESKGCGT